MASTFVVCLRCGKVHETDGVDQLPKGWQRSHSDLVCPNCTDTNVLDTDAAGDVLDEEVLYPSSDTPDEDECEICGGPCQGH